MKKIKFIITTVFLVAMSSAASAQVMYKVSKPKDKSGKPSYLFGTIHMLCKGQWEVSSALEQQVKSCKTIVVELDMSDPQVVSKATVSSLKAADTLLVDLLPESEFKVVSGFFSDSLKIPFNYVAKLQPNILSTLISFKLNPCSPIAADNMLLESAKKYNLKVFPLETPEEQLIALGNMSLKAQAKSLYEAILDHKKVAQINLDMQNAWIQHQSDSLQIIITKSVVHSPENEAFIMSMLDNRNANWMKVLPKMFEKEATFVAVGAAHLLGKNGLVRKFRALGYTCVEVKLP